LNGAKATAEIAPAISATTKRRQPHRTMIALAKDRSLVALRSQAFSG